MYFKSLELLGFKSFGEKTKLNFEPGVTAIVGPNGCGKSNIADSIRWVLGEQSAKSLRASNMQDVIFNGTDTKEPINFAEVSLTFSNQNRALPIDYDEVTITRRVFRSGETEYLLNKTPVRLKDISELLMGTGIGTESYSIIEQGKMDLILSSKPEDRRYVFEEASGITKYKSKKKEALRKLEQTEQNLLRINDIIQEVKRQISSIERQARKAERYKVDFDRLKDLEVKLSFSEYKNLKTREATYLVEGDDARSREKESDQDIKTIALTISDHRQTLDGINIKMSEVRGKLGELTNSLNMNAHKRQIDKERIEEARSFQEGLKKEVDSISAKMQEARLSVDRLKDDLKSAVSTKSEKDKIIGEKELLINNLTGEIEETEISVKTFKVEIVDYLAKETRIKNELIKIGADIQNRKARQRRIHLEKETVGNELYSIVQALDGVLSEFAQVEARFSSVRADLDTKKAGHNSISAEIKTLESDIAKEENRSTAVKSKIEMLEDTLKRYEGFNRGVRNLLMKVDEDKSAFCGVVGVLADLVKVERGYEEAISAFLGDDAQIVITESDQDISKMIGYLKDNNLGKATFVSMETLKKAARIDPRHGDVPPHGLVMLRNYVMVNERLEGLIGHFFWNSYLAESFDEGLRIAGGSGGVRIVTKAGHMFDNYKVSGGSSADSDESLLIGRKERLEDLKASLVQAEASLLSLTSARDEKTSSLQALQSEIGNLEEALHKEEMSLSNIKVKKDAQDESAKKIKTELEVLDSELLDADQEVSDLTTKGGVLNTELNSIETEKTSKQSFIEESQDVVLGKRSEKEASTLEVATLKAESLSIERDVENTKNNLKGQETMLFEFEDTLYSKEADLKESLAKAGLLEEEILSLTSKNREIDINIKSLEEESKAIETSKSAIIDKMSLDQAQLSQKEKEIEFLRNQIRDIDVKLTEINYKKTNLKDRIGQAYKVDLEITHVDLEESTDWDSVKSQVTELKDRLDKIGPVNLIAIDEHKELEERHSFLVHQQEDLVNAKDSLLKAIQKINKTTKELFLETFQKIQVEFKGFFRLLFGGGQAELVLIDEQDILESGIEIIVRPPGKKLQNLMLLSGGEKALTATALLFAIFKVKPSPFCVLDEIDAPLDESNINRFSNVLKDLMKISQFIIITHNKRTIELADVMYGITMQERGVSKIVSVKFLDEKQKSEEPKSDAKTDTVPV